MQICYYCAGWSSFWQFRCRNCGRFLWRTSHAPVLVLGGLFCAYLLLSLVW